MDALRCDAMFPLLLRLEVGEHGLGIRNLEGIGARVLLHRAALDEELLHLHVVDDGSVAPGALAKAAFCVPCAAHAHSACEEAGAVRQELHLLEVSGVERVRRVLLLLRKLLVQTPLPHHEGVIDGQAIDVVDTAALDGLVMLLVAGEVGGRAGGREGAGQREDDNALALEDIRGLDVLPGEGVVAGDLENHKIWEVGGKWTGHEWSGEEEESAEEERFLWLGKCSRIPCSWNCHVAL